MGAVYEVEHEQLGVRYALKAFSTKNKYADVLKKKFLAEGKVLARLRDPHLIRVFDLAIDDATGVPYFVMDITTVPHRQNITVGRRIKRHSRPKRIVI